MNNATIQMPESSRKTVALVLTLGIEAWIRAEAKKRNVSMAEVGRKVFEKAMRESEKGLAA